MDVYKRHFFVSGSIFILILVKLIFFLSCEVLPFGEWDNPADPHKDKDDTPPAEVTDLVVTGGDGIVTVSWTNPDNIDFVEVEIWFGIDGNPDTEWPGTKDFLGTEITGLEANTEYTVKVVTKDDFGNVSQGETATVTTDTGVTPEIINMQLNQTGSDEITVSWEAITGADYEYVEIWYGETTTDENKYEGSVSNTGTPITGLESGTEYTFEVKAFDGDGNEVASFDERTAISYVGIEAPSFDLTDGTYNEIQTVIITNNSEGFADVYYTIDGSDPITSSTRDLYTTEISIDMSTTLNAVALTTQEGHDQSTFDITSASYELKVATPSISLESGDYTDSSVTIDFSTTSVSGDITATTYWYTTDGSTPAEGTGTTGSGSSISLNADSTVKVYAAIPGWTDSDIVTAEYDLNSSDITPENGSFLGSEKTFTIPRTVGVGYYGIEISTDETDFVSNIIEDITQPSSTSFTLDDTVVLNSGQTYYWRIKNYVVDSWVYPTTDIYSFKTTPALGDETEGGIVFYIDTDNRVAYVADEIDLDATYPWSSSYVFIDDTESGIGTGLSNTNNIYTALSGDVNSAAYQCLIFTDDDGYDDWYLPSQDELHLMWQNLHSQGLGGFSNGYFWSSTENSTNYAFRENFWSSGSGGTSYSSVKTTSSYVRPIRSFTY